MLFLGCNSGYCLDGSCEALKNPGDVCDVDAQCSSGDYCVNSDAMGNKVCCNVAEPCNIDCDEICTPGSFNGCTACGGDPNKYCSGGMPSSCDDKKVVGDSCSGDDADYECRSGDCQLANVEAFRCIGTAGDACVGNSNSVSQPSCTDTGRCICPSDANGACSGACDDECLPFSQYSGTVFMLLLFLKK